MQRISINVTKIPREKIKPGKNGKYVELILHENKNGPDQYGNDGFVAIDVTKEERQAGERGAIIGNWKHVGQRPQQAAPRSRPQPPPGQPEYDDDVQESDIPF